MLMVSTVAFGSGIEIRFGLDGPFFSAWSQPPEDLTKQVEAS
jgi:hypothetical protein